MVGGETKQRLAAILRRCKASRHTRVPTGRETRANWSKRVNNLGFRKTDIRPAGSQKHPVTTMSGRVLNSCNFYDIKNILYNWLDLCYWQVTASLDMSEIRNVKSINHRFREIWLSGKVFHSSFM